MTAKRRDFDIGQGLPPHLTLAPTAMPPPLPLPASAFFQTDTHCHLYKLTTQCFQAILSFYPEVFEPIVSQGRSRLPIERRATASPIICIDSPEAAPPPAPESAPEPSGPEVAEPLPPEIVPPTHVVNRAARAWLGLVRRSSSSATSQAAAASGAPPSPRGELMAVGPVDAGVPGRSRSKSLSPMPAGSSGGGTPLASRRSSAVPDVARPRAMTIGSGRAGSGGRLRRSMSGQGHYLQPDAVGEGAGSRRRSILYDPAARKFLALAMSTRPRGGSLMENDPNNPVRCGSRGARGSEVVWLRVV